MKKLLFILIALSSFSFASEPWVVHIIGDVSGVYNAFNYIAMLLQDNTLYYVKYFGVIASLAYFFYRASQHSVGGMVTEFIFLICVLLFFLTPSASVAIVDSRVDANVPTNDSGYMKSATVDNVPLGMAIIASTTTTFSFEIASLMETVADAVSKTPGLGVTQVGFNQPAIDMNWLIKNAMSSSKDNVDINNFELRFNKFFEECLLPTVNIDSSYAAKINNPGENWIATIKSANFPYNDISVIDPVDGSNRTCDNMLETIDGTQEAFSEELYKNFTAYKGVDSAVSSGYDANYAHLILGTQIANLASVKDVMSNLRISSIANGAVLRSGTGIAGIDMSTTSSMENAKQAMMIQGPSMWSWVGEMLPMGINISIAFLLYMSLLMSLFLLFQGAMKGISIIVNYISGFFALTFAYISLAIVQGIVNQYAAFNATKNYLSMGSPYGLSNFDFLLGQSATMQGLSGLLGGFFVLAGSAIVFYGESKLLVNGVLGKIQGLYGGNSLDQGMEEAVGQNALLSNIERYNKDNMHNRVNELGIPVEGGNIELAYSKMQQQLEALSSGHASHEQLGNSNDMSEYLDGIEAQATSKIKNTKGVGSAINEFASTMEGGNTRDNIGQAIELFSDGAFGEGRGATKAELQKSELYRGNSESFERGMELGGIQKANELIGLGNTQFEDGNKNPISDKEWGENIRKSASVQANQAAIKASALSEEVETDDETGKYSLKEAFAKGTYRGELESIGAIEAKGLVDLDGGEISDEDWKANVIAQERKKSTESQAFGEKIRNKFGDGFTKEAGYLDDFSEKNTEEDKQDVDSDNHTDKAERNDKFNKDTNNIKFKNKNENTGGGKHFEILADVARAVQAQDDSSIVTAMNDSHHAKERPNSDHHKGFAIDFTYKGLSGKGATLNNKSLAKQKENELRATLSDMGIDQNDYRILNEYIKPSNGATGGHLHLNFKDAKTAAKYSELMNQHGDLKSSRIGRIGKTVFPDINVNNPEKQSKSPFIKNPNDYGVINDESGGNPRAIRNENNGTKSYGLYQINSSNMGRFLQKYANQDVKDYFENLNPNSREFSKRVKNMPDNIAKSFSFSQADYMNKEHFAPAIKQVESMTGMELSNKPSLQNIIKHAAEAGNNVVNYVASRINNRKDTHTTDSELASIVAEDVASDVPKLWKSSNLSTQNSVTKRWVKLAEQNGASNIGNFGVGGYADIGEYSGPVDALSMQKMASLKAEKALQGDIGDAQSTREILNADAQGIQKTTFVGSMVSGIGALESIKAQGGITEAVNTGVTQKAIEAGENQAALVGKVQKLGESTGMDGDSAKKLAEGIVEGSKQASDIMKSAIMEASKSISYVGSAEKTAQGAQHADVLKDSYGSNLDRSFHGMSMEDTANITERKKLDEITGAAKEDSKQIHDNKNVFFENAEYGEASKVGSTQVKILAQGGTHEAAAVDISEASMKATEQKESIKSKVKEAAKAKGATKDRAKEIANELLNGDLSSEDTSNTMASSGIAGAVGTIASAQSGAKVRSDAKEIMQYSKSGHDLDNEAVEGFEQSAGIAGAKKGITGKFSNIIANEDEMAQKFVDGMRNWTGANKDKQGQNEFLQSMIGAGMVTQDSTFDNMKATSGEQFARGRAILSAGHMNMLEKMTIAGSDVMVNQDLISGKVRTEDVSGNKSRDGDSISHEYGVDWQKPVQTAGKEVGIDTVAGDGANGDWNDKIGAGAVFGLGAGAVVVGTYALLNKVSGKRLDKGLDWVTHTMKGDKVVTDKAGNEKWYSQDAIGKLGDDIVSDGKGGYKFEGGTFEDANKLIDQRSTSVRPAKYDQTTETTKPKTAPTNIDDATSDISDSFDKDNKTSSNDGVSDNYTENNEKSQVKSEHSTKNKAQSLLEYVRKNPKQMGVITVATGVSLYNEGTKLIDNAKEVASDIKEYFTGDDNENIKDGSAATSSSHSNDSNNNKTSSIEGYTDSFAPAVAIGAMGTMAMRGTPIGSIAGTFMGMSEAGDKISDTMKQGKNAIASKLPDMKSFGKTALKVGIPAGVAAYVASEIFNNNSSENANKDEQNRGMTEEQSNAAIAGTTQISQGAFSGTMDVVSGRAKGLAELGKIGTYAEGLKDTAKDFFTINDKVAGKTALGTVAKTSANFAAKKIPGVGLVMGAGMAYDRASDGDYLGASMELVSGVASTVPGIGTAISTGLDVTLIAKDQLSKDSQASDKTAEKTQDTSKDSQAPTHTAAQSTEQKVQAPGQTPTASPLKGTQPTAAQAQGETPKAEGTS
ncbi:conjugal transfer protein TraG N-terminal domain-containing protein, partial [Aquamicrobium sp.]|uniref:conjugal transfer protein TraG N-terminal domain-containing protein n=1 Tax=Aquamicrobium sp. TaxID=1872579 RepID=UPI00258E85AA